MISVSKKHLTRTDASHYLTNVLGLPVSKKTLEKFATEGGGPEYQKFGSRRVLYTAEALNNWAENRLSNPIEHSGQEAKYDNRK